MAPLSPVSLIQFNSTQCFSHSAFFSKVLYLGASTFLGLLVGVNSVVAFAENTASALPQMPSIISSDDANTTAASTTVGAAVGMPSTVVPSVAMPAIAVSAPLARQHWVVAIPGGVPASQPEDTPQRWVLRVIPYAADGSDASVVMGSQEVLRFRAACNGKTAYDRAVASTSLLKSVIDASETPQKLRSNLKVSVLGGQPVLMIGSEVIATADDATAQQAQMPPAQLAGVWQGYFHKAFTPSWEAYTALPKATAPKSSVKTASPSAKLSTAKASETVAVKVPAKAVTTANVAAKPPHVAIKAPLSKITLGKSPVKASASSLPTKPQAKPVASSISVGNAAKANSVTPILPEAVTTPEAAEPVPVSATRQAILAQIASQQASSQLDADLIKAPETSATSGSLPAKLFAKKDFQATPRLGEPSTPFFKPLGTPTVLQTGMASWYGDQFHGRRTSSGQRFDMHGYTAAHRTLPFGTKLKVTNLANGRSVMVTVNDRGPFGHGRIIDLSKAAAREIGLMSMGVARVSLAKMPKLSPKASPKLLPKKLAMLPPSKLGY